MKKRIVEKELGIPPDYQYKALNNSNFIHSNWHKNKLEALEHLLELDETTRILDIGFGSGNFELHFADKVDEIVGIDYNEEAVEYAKGLMKRNNIENVNIRAGDARKLKKLGKFDYIIMVDVIEHFKPDQARQVIKSFKKHLNKNGKICLITPNFKSTWVILEWILDKFKLAPELGGKQHLSKFNPKNIRRIFEDNGYQVVTISTFNTFAFLSPFDSLRHTLNSLEVKHLKYGNLLAIIAKR